MLEELKAIQQGIEQEFNNLSDHSWIADKLKALKVQYDLLGDLINKLEKDTPKVEQLDTKSRKSSTKV
jgi:hypothetical protein